MATLDKIQQIEQDFTEQNEPFDDVEFPEERLLRELATDDEGEVWRMSMEDKLAAISLFCTLDYNRDANQLVDKILEAADHDAVNIFNPHAVEKSGKSVEYLFEEISFRYSSRDAHAWQKNCRILVENYNGKWHELLMDTGMNAPALIERLNDDDFNCLKGVKIAPMYARIINDEVAPMDGLWDIDIPVDSHIRRLSKDLFGEDDISDDEIRDMWQFYGLQNDISRHLVDGALWHIGNKWDSWGEEYWNSLD